MANIEIFEADAAGPEDVAAKTELRIFGSGDSAMLVEIDAETGVVLGDQNAPDETASALEAVAYIAHRKPYVDAQLAALRAERDAHLKRIAECYDVRIRTLENIQLWLKSGAKWGDVLRHFLRGAIEGKKTRTITMGLLQICFRKKNAKVVIVDPDAAVAYCKLVCPSAIKESVGISLVPDAVKSAFLTEERAPAHSGFAVERETDIFEIK